MNAFLSRAFICLTLISSLVGCKKSKEEPPPPKSFSFTPASGIADDELIISISGFDPSSADMQVIFNGREAQIISSDQTKITVTVPPGVTTGPVTLITGIDTLTSSGVFTVLGTTQDIGTLKPGDVLVAGTGSRGGMLYKNGVRIDKLCYQQASFEWIAVDGNDVYTAGYLNGMATYWKNGVPFSPAEGIVEGSIHAIKIVNGKPHMVGVRRGSQQLAVYWHDGIEDTLPTDDVPYSEAWDIVVDGNDVHIVGATRASIYFGVSIGRYWKNGQLMTVNNVGNNSFLYSIAVTGNDVHIAGYRTLSDGSRTVACHWKNGIPTIVSNPTKNAKAFSIAVDGQDVYIAGEESRAGNSNSMTAIYWKNGVAVPMLDGQVATAVDVFGGNAYISGHNAPSSTTAFLWKNGEIMSFNQPEMKYSEGYYVHVVK